MILLRKGGLRGRAELVCTPLVKSLEMEAVAWDVPALGMGRGERGMKMGGFLRVMDGRWREEERDLCEAGRVFGALVVRDIRGGLRVDEGLVLLSTTVGCWTSRILRRLSTVFFAITPSEEEDEDSFSSSVGGVIRLISGGG